MATHDKDRVVLIFATDADLVDDVYEARALDPAAFSWVLFFTSAPVDDDTALVTVAITRKQYEYFLGAMDDVAEHVPSLIRAEIYAEACQLEEAD